MEVQVYEVRKIGAEALRATGSPYAICLKVYPHILDAAVSVLVCAFADQDHLESIRYGKGGAEV